MCNLEVVYDGYVHHPYSSTLCRSYKIYKDGDSGIVELTQGAKAIFDMNLLDRVIEENWRYNGGYAVTNIKGDALFLHNHINNFCTQDYDYTIDHKSKNKLDNRLVNLRLATQSQQSFNRNFPTKTGFRGVMLRSDRNLYRIYGRTLDNKRISLGHTKCPIAGAHRWDEYMYETFKNENPLSGVEVNGVTGEPTLNFIDFNFPERLGL